MPCSIANSLIGRPASCCLRIKTICGSVNRVFFMIVPFKLEIFSNSQWARYGESDSSHAFIVVCKSNFPGHHAVTIDALVDATLQKIHTCQISYNQTATCHPFFYPFYVAGIIVVGLVAPGFIHNACRDVLLAGAGKQGIIIFHQGKMRVAPQRHFVYPCNGGRVLPEV
jgi:hypothetical protein